MPLQFYYNDSRAQGTQFVQFDPKGYDPLNFLPDANYHFDVLKNLECHWVGQDLKIVVTWSLTELPFYGQDVIAYVLGDEHYQIPDYIKRVGAVIKTMGVGPYNESRQRPNNFHLNIVEKRRYLSLKSEYEKRNEKNSHSLKELESIFVIPLGPYKYIPQPYKPVCDRTLDIFFAGRIVPPSGAIQALLNQLRPITVARTQMVRGLKKAQVNNPGWKIEPDLRAESISGNLPPEEYSQKIANSKIALCPRGSHPESFRFFEAAHAGCILIADYLPDFWYYKACPAIQIDNWNSLNDLATSLLASPEKLQELSDKTREWYHKVVSAEVIGRVSAEFLAQRFN